jgi:hypothetical protein
MINRAHALEIRDLALASIESLSKGLDLALATASPETAERLKRGVGLSIGTIDTKLLSVLYTLHPDLDHRRERH